MAAHIDKNLLEHIAHLARLRLHEQEQERYGRELSTILTYMAQLDELDTADVVPTAQTLAVKNVLRDDDLVPSCPHEQALQNAPQKDGAFFAVPRIIDQEVSGNEP